MDFVYCDHNAGAPIRPEASEAVARALSAANPSSIHRAGRAAKAMLEDAREALARAVGAAPENVVFASGATEALHLALAASGARSLVVSALEHDAVFAQAPLVSRSSDAPLFVAPATHDGVVDLSALEALLAAAPKPALVALMLANNETGAIQPVARAAALVREAGAMLLVDAAQALGRIRVDLTSLDATYLVVSSHKIGGPQGVGALVLAPGAPFVTPGAGGGQERGRRPGTENVASLAGFGVAAASAVRDLDGEALRLAALRDRFEAALPRGARVFATSSPRLPNTSLFAMPNLRAESAVIALDLAGVCVSSGAACSSGKVRPSRVLAAMGVSEADSRRALRVSFGWNSTEADVDAALAAIHALAARHAEAA